VALLGRYVWYTKNSQDRAMLAGGTLRPNDLGLFDVLGNALEWCQDPIFHYDPGSPEMPNEDKQFTDDIKSILGEPSRLLRGGSFFNQPRDVRSSNRFRVRPADANTYVGFRPARTFP
jgi:formylglycine-generating enzyme required for sulfatase activity